MDKEALNSEAPIESECCISDTEACSKSPGQSRTDLKHNPPELLPAAWLRLRFVLPTTLTLIVFVLQTLMRLIAVTYILKCRGMSSWCCPEDDILGIGLQFAVNRAFLTV